MVVKQHVDCGLLAIPLSLLVLPTDLSLDTELFGDESLEHEMLSMHGVLLSISVVPLK